MLFKVYIKDEDSLRKNMTHRNHAKDRNDTWTKVTNGNWKVPHMTINRFMGYLFRILVWHSEQLFHYFCARIGFFFWQIREHKCRKKIGNFLVFVILPVAYQQISRSGILIFQVLQKSGNTIQKSLRIPLSPFFSHIQ